MEVDVQRCDIRAPVTSGGQLGLCCDDNNLNGAVTVGRESRVPIRVIKRTELSGPGDQLFGCGSQMVPTLSLEEGEDMLIFGG